MGDTEIRIILDGTAEQGTVASPERVDEPNIEQPTQPKQRQQATGQGAGKSAAVVLGTQIAKQATNYASSRVGEWTGNTQTQRMIDLSGQIATYGVAIAINPAIGLTMLGISVGTNVIDYFYNRSKENLSLSVLQKRAGATQNRSR